MSTEPSSSPPPTSTTRSDRLRSDQDPPRIDATGRAPAAGERALVLGGGGSTGNAWLIGVIAGLFDAGLDVTTADLTIGTSAGSTAAAQIAGATPTELLAAILAAAPEHRTGPVGSDRGRVPIRPVADHMERMGTIIASADDAADMRRRMGAAALDMEAASDGSWQAQWRATAAASCASSLPYRIGDNRYIDGGWRSNAENADLAAGYGRVLVLSPLGGRALTPVGWGMHLATQVDVLRTRGSRVETIFPDSSSEHMFGINTMDPSLRSPAARAGYDQGKALAEKLTGFWR